MTPDRIVINKKLIPYSFDIVITGTLFNFRIDYNTTEGFFTVTLKKGSKVIVYNEPIAYGQKLFSGVYMNNGDFPACDIIPLDLSGKEDTVTWENFGSSVFLWLDNGEEVLA